MCKQSGKHISSFGENKASIYTTQIGELFLNYGEQYIQTYNPSRQQIKLIKSIRICKTPALGGRVIICKECGHNHYIYKSCGNSQCMICQSIKREQWLDKLKASLLDVPYMHTVFTMPHRLNGLCRGNQKQLYSVIMKAAWNTVNTISKEQGFSPGMTSVLHTFGSDMKYHIHVHAMVTFGGIDKKGEWKYPDKNYALTSYRKMCGIFKNEFTKLLRKHTKEINYHESIDSLINDVSKLRWVVHTTKPTMNTGIIENYLAKYINRIAISKNRLQYIKENEEVLLLYNDYKHQQKGKPAPKLLQRLHPMTAIHQILQHVLPSRFQKTRSYGLHNNTSKINNLIPEKLKRNKDTIRSIFQIITTLINQHPYRCEKCESTEYIIEDIPKHSRWIYRFLSIDSLKSPPNQIKNGAAKLSANQNLHSSPLPISKENT
jgi:hypothetical protein